MKSTDIEFHLIFLGFLWEQEGDLGGIGELPRILYDFLLKMFR